MFGHFQKLTLELVALHIHLQHVLLDRGDLLGLVLGSGKLWIGLDPATSRLIVRLHVVWDSIETALEVCAEHILHV